MFGKNKNLENRLSLVEHQEQRFFKDIDFRLNSIEQEWAKFLSRNQDLEKRIKTLEEIISVQKAEIEDLKHDKKQTKSKIISSNARLTEEQQKALSEILSNRDNYFVTGKAGTGKSTLLKELVKASDPKKVAVVAYTGAAALNVGGQTIHSFFYLGLEPQNVQDPESVNMPTYTKEVLSAVDTLIIDEISMVRSDVLDMMDKKMQQARGNARPFGGCKIIAFGDLYQLAPIAGTRDEKEFICSRYRTLYFFGAPAADTFKILELKTVMRQNDEKFIAALNEIRLGKVSQETLAYLNSSATKQIPDGWMHLTLKRDVAAVINQQKLDKIQGKETVYKTTFGGANPPTPEEVAFDYTLPLKVGARVIAVMNDIAKKYVNGSVGVVVELKEDSVIVNFNGVDVLVGKLIWEKRKYVYDKKTRSLSCEITGWASQLPLKLAYAITVHKAQGQTYDNVVLDFQGCKTFSAGQTYVALSRCRSLAGLKLTRPIRPEDIFINEEVTDYLNGTFLSKTENEALKQKLIDYDEMELAF